VGVAFRPIESAQELPEQDALETAALDFKQAHEPHKSYECAKDVAAQANTLGGSLIIGAIEDRATLRLKSYRDVSATAKDARRDYEHAVRDLCAPRPTYTFRELERDGATVVVVNVPPSMSLISVRDPASSVGAFTFPTRVGPHTVNITPEALPMHMDPRTRRAVLLLSSIPPDANVFVQSARGFDVRNVHQRSRVVTVDSDRNAVTFEIPTQDGAGVRISYPIDRLETVYFNPEAKHWRALFAALP
jgi:hypothetical protein